MVNSAQKAIKRLKEKDAKAAESAAASGSGRTLQRQVTEATEPADSPAGAGDLDKDDDMAGNSSDDSQHGKKKAKTFTDPVPDEAGDRANSSASAAASAPAPAPPPTTAMTIEDLASLMATQQLKATQQYAHFMGVVQSEFLQMNLRNAQVDRRFDLLEARINGLESFPPEVPFPAAAPRPAPWTRADISTSSSCSAAAAPAAPAAPGPTIKVNTAPTPPSSKAAAGTTQNRLWIKGFGTTQTTKTMASYAKLYLDRVPDLIRNKAVIRGVGFGVSTSIVFPTKDDADEAHRFMQEHHEDFYNKDTAETLPLRAVKDKPLFVRSRDRVLGGLWQKVNSHLLNTKQFAEFKLGQSNGKLFLIVEEVPKELFRITTIKVDSDARYEVSPNSSNLLKIGIQSTTASAWAEAAAEGAAAV
jgi:hypothetical protein